MFTQQHYNYFNMFIVPHDFTELNHKLNMNYVKGYLIECEKKSKCMHCCTKLILIIYVHYRSFQKKLRILDSHLISALSLTEMCHRFPPTEGQILKHNHNSQFVLEKKKVPKETNICHLMLKHRQYLFFFSPVT